MSDEMRDPRGAVLAEIIDERLDAADQVRQAWPEVVEALKDAHSAALKLAAFVSRAALEVDEYDEGTARRMKMAVQYWKLAGDRPALAALARAREIKPEEHQDA